MNMHKEILTKEQLLIFSRLKIFSTKFGLIGGTAIALHIGHRQSIDFDLASTEEFDNHKIRKEILRIGKIQSVLVDKKGEFTIVIEGIKFTFLHYPFAIEFSEIVNSIIKLPDLLTLAAMKAYALGRRAKWKDNVDLYFIIKKYHGISKIVKKAKKIFKKEFNEKIFRSQLAYFKDIDYTEEVIFMSGQKISDKIIKKALVEYSLG